MSEAYNHKKKVRDLRELERDLHNHAIQVYKDFYADPAAKNVNTGGLEQSSSIVIDDLTIQHNPVTMDKTYNPRSQVNRNIVKRIKKDLVVQDPKYVSLKKKFLGTTFPKTPTGEGPVMQDLQASNQSEQEPL